MSVIVGDAVVDRVPEHELPVPLWLLTEDAQLISDWITPLPPGFLDPSDGTFLFSNHSWLIRVDGLTILLDPATGNGRTGLGPHFDGLDTPYLQRLTDLDAPAGAIDIVYSTHFHHDHCGWNTEPVDGRWRTTFPRASYVFVRAEYDRWDTSRPAHANCYNPSVFDNCIRPVVEAGQARLVSPPHRISPSVTIESAPGHTDGHTALRLDSAGQVAYFTGDSFHHPIQMTRPELHLPGCDDLTGAIATRQSLLRRIVDDDALVFPAHFSAPHYGALEQTSDGIRFIPGPAL